MGRPEGPRCYCAVNNLLRKSLDDLSRNYAAVVVDNEAGMEHLSRRTTNDVDFLMVVMNPTLPSVRAARRILELSRELPVQIGRRVLLVNRVGPEGVPEEVERGIGRRLHAERLPDVPQDDERGARGRRRADVFRLSAQKPGAGGGAECRRKHCASATADAGIQH